MKSLRIFLVYLIASLFISSCQKPVSDPIPVDPIPPTSSVDSTLLIRSIRFTNFEEDGTTISYSESQIFSYDTVNKKIFISYETAGSPVNYFPTLEFSYNQDNQLIKASYTYLPDYTSTADDFKLITFEYDSEKFISKFVVTYGDGHVKTVPILKRKLAGSITELERDVDYLDQYPDSKSRYKVRTGLDVNHNKLYTISDEYFDGIFRGAFKQLSTYSTAGDMTKFAIEETNANNEIQSNSTVCEISAYSPEANQLFDQQKILFHGIDDLQNSDEIFGFGGPLSQFIGTGEQALFYNHLFTTATAYSDLGGPQPLKSIIVHDNKGRLIKFRGYFLDGVAIPNDYEINYYKD